MTQPTDAELMARAGAGDAPAFGQIVDRHKDGLVGYLSRLTGDRERAEELAQETFLRVFQHVDRYRENGHFAAYLFKIATNLLRSDARKERRRHSLAHMVSTPGDELDRSAAVGAVNGAHAAGPDAIAMNSELQRQLSAAISALPIHYRVPLVLHDVEDWTYDEIARVTGSKEGTIKSRISRGRKQLRKRLEPFRDGVEA